MKVSRRKRVVEAPSDLDDVGAKKWAALVCDSKWAALVGSINQDLLTEYCRLHARKAKADAKVAEHGELVASPNGFPVQSPWLAIANKCRADMMAIHKHVFSAGASASVGKKAQANVDAVTAARGTEWDNLLTPGAPVQ